MNPYREASPIVPYWETPQVGDLVRVRGCVGDVIGYGEDTCGLVQVFFDFFSQYYWPTEVLVIERSGDTKGVTR